jgi:4-hydroxy-2-oxoheptanedioate aldolase
MKNKLKQILASKRPAIGTWVAIPDVYAVEMIAGLGFDWLLVDMEHIPISKESLRAILMAVKGSDSVPIVRVASATVENFQSALDLGAQGVMVPMINSVEDAENAVRYCRYPPLGRRGFGPVRASEYTRRADEYDLANFMNYDAKAGSANVQRVVEDLIKMATSASIPIGLPTWSPAEFSRYMKLGATLLTIGSDLSFLATQAETQLKGVRRLLSGSPAKS